MYRKLRIKPNTAPAKANSFLLGNDGSSGVLARETMVTLFTLMIFLICCLKTLATVLATTADSCGSSVLTWREKTCEFCWVWTLMASFNSAVERL